MHLKLKSKNSKVISCVAVLYFNLKEKNRPDKIGAVQVGVILYQPSQVWQANRKIHFIEFFKTGRRYRMTIFYRGCFDLTGFHGFAEIYNNRAIYLRNPYSSV
jgi:hypothetical protein